MQCFSMTSVEVKGSGALGGPRQTGGRYDLGQSSSNHNSEPQVQLLSSAQKFPHHGGEQEFALTSVRAFTQVNRIWNCGGL